MGRLYNFFSGTNSKSGKGITKKQVEFDKKLGFGFFFKLMKMRLGKFSASNLIFALCNIFLFVALFGLSGTLDEYTTTAADPLYAQISAIAKNDNGPAIATLYTAFCASASRRIFSTTSKILIYSAVVLVFTFGLSTIGLVYNIRNICTGEHVYTWHDFFYAIKRNFKQGIVIGILDSIIIIVLVYDLIVYSASSSLSFMNLVFFYSIIAISAIYYVMRFYIYLQLVTCKMTIGKIIKNSFLLTALGIKRNLIGILAVVAIVILYIYIYILLPQVAIILFCMFMFSLLTYIGIYCAYPVFKKYVVDPYYDDHPDERPEDPWSTEDRVFVDRG